MRLLFSSIAWRREQANEVGVALRNLNFDGIEASPGLFDRPLQEVTSAHIAECRSFWEDRGLCIGAMQSLLYGHPEFNLFGNREEQKQLADYLSLVFVIAGNLGCGPLIFGSPQNRLRGLLSEADAMDWAATFFSKLAPVAKAEGCILCIEANSVGYGCDFVTSHNQAIQLVDMVNSDGFGLQLDTGVMLMNDEQDTVLDLLRQNKIVPHHIHFSSPFLVPVYASLPIYHNLLSYLREIHYGGCVSVEMRAPEGGVAGIATSACSVKQFWEEYYENV